MALDGLRLAVGTLTVIPTGAVVTTPATARHAMLLAPVAVLPVAVAAAAAGWLTAVPGAPDLLTGLAVVGVLAILTRGIHLDGLADLADGLGSGWDRERALAVMRRGDVGPMGVVTLVITVTVQAAAIGSVLQDLRGALLVAALICCSRAALAVACRTGVPAARPDGLGAAVAGTVPTPEAVAIWLGVLMVLGTQTWVGAVAGVAAVLATLALVHRAVRRLGGVTGDVLGAAVEVALTTMLVVLAL